MVVHIVIGGILPISRRSISIILVLDLLLEGRLIGLTGDGHCLVTDNLNDVQSSCIITGYIFLVLGEVIASRNVAQRLAGRYCTVRNFSHINELFDSFKLRRIGSIAIKSSHSLGSFSGCQVSTISTGCVLGLEVLASCNVAKRTIRTVRTCENLVDGIGVGISVSDFDTTSWICRHGGGGTGETGDGHCCGGCHSDEAFENLIHRSPFLRNRNYFFLFHSYSVIA